MTQGEELRKDAASIAEAVTRITSLKYGNLQAFMTVLGYVVYFIIHGVAKTQKHDLADEVAKFGLYVADIVKTESEAEDKQHSANIVKLN